MAGAASAVGELRRAIRQFLQDAGDDPTLRGLASDVRSLDVKLGEQSRGDQGGDVSPGQRAAGITSGAGPQGSARQGARQAMGADSAKGQGSNLPPFMRRQQMKGRATARKGS